MWGCLRLRDSVSLQPDGAVFAKLGIFDIVERLLGFPCSTESRGVVGRPAHVAHGASLDGRMLEFGRRLPALCSAPRGNTLRALVGSLRQGSRNFVVLQCVSLAHASGAFINMAWAALPPPRTPLVRAMVLCGAERSGNLVSRCEALGLQ